MPDPHPTGAVPETPPLQEAEIHVWSASLDRPPVSREDLRSCLSTEELSRSSRFVFDERRARFEVAHGLRRWILGAYVRRRPEVLEFSVGREGKPGLKRAGERGLSIEFNVSDSAGHFLMGVSRRTPIGVDVECFRPVQDLASIASRFFAPAEADFLFSLPESRRERAFFECWTRKEAIVKAVGKGLTIPLDAFEVSFGPQRPPALRTVRGSEVEAARWSLWGFDATHEAVGAVAVQETERSLVFLRWADALRVERRMP